MGHLLYSYTQRVHRIWNTHCTLILKESTVYGTLAGVHRIWDTLYSYTQRVHGIWDTHCTLSPPYMGHTLYSYTQRVHRIWDTHCTLILKESTVYGTHTVLLYSKSPPYMGPTLYEVVAGVVKESQRCRRGKRGR